MRLLRLMITGLALGLAIAGCATPEHWAKRGATGQDFATDLSSCEAMAAQAHPYLEKTTQFGNVHARNRASCTQSGVFLTCTGMGADLAPPTTISYDANEGKRKDLVRSCMQGKGWQPVPPP
jgi:hypothetical protein